VVAGRPTLFVGADERPLGPGMVAGFPCNGQPHHVENRTAEDCLILEVGDRSRDDEVSYPTDDIEAVAGQDGQWRFAHKDGRSY
jgi:uncharacterized cupin superfamily protein